MHYLDFIQTVKTLQQVLINLENENFPSETTDQIHDIINELKDDKNQSRIEKDLHHIDILLTVYYETQYPALPNKEVLQTIPYYFAIKFYSLI